MFCAKCGAEVSDGTHLCEKCKNTLQEEIAEKQQDEVEIEYDIVEELRQVQKQQKLSAMIGWIVLCCAMLMVGGIYIAKKVKVAQRERSHVENTMTSTQEEYRNPYDELPESVRQEVDEQGEELADIQELNLSGSSEEQRELDFESLEWLKYFPNLEELDLHNTDLSSLEGMPDSMSKLNYLDLDNTEISSLEGVSSNLPNLCYLYLGSTYLENLEGLPSSLPSLNELWVNQTNIISLEGLPDDLSNLCTLRLNDTNISILDGMSNDLSNLCYLHLDNTQISSLEGLPSSLPSLVELHVDNTNISDIYDLEFFPEIPNDCRIYWGDIQITYEEYINSFEEDDDEEYEEQYESEESEEISYDYESDYYDNLPNMVQDLLDGEGILPEDIKTVYLGEYSSSVSSTILYLSIEDINFYGLEWLEYLPNLDTLYFREGTEIDTLECLPSSLPNLSYLSVQGTSIKSLKGLPSYLPYLEIIQAQNTELESLEGLPSSLPNLQLINLSDTKLRSLEGLPNSLPNLETMNLNNTYLYDLEGMPDSMPSLRVLKIMNTTSDTGSTFLASLEGMPRELPNLEELFLSHTGITSLEGISDSLPNLYRLHLWGTRLTSLEGLPELPSDCWIYWKISVMSYQDYMNSIDE